MTYSSPSDLSTTIDPSGQKEVAQNYGLTKAAFQALSPQIVAFDSAPTASQTLRTLVANYTATDTVTFTFPSVMYNYGSMTSLGRGSFSGSNARHAISTVPTQPDSLYDWFDATITSTGGRGVKALGFCAGFRNDQAVSAGQVLFTLSDATTETITLPALGGAGNPEYVFIGYQAPAGKTISRVQASRTSGPGGGYVSVDDLSFVMQPSVSLSVNPTSFSENGATATVTATLSNTTTDTVTVNLGYTAGTATLGTDYTAGNSITINAGSLTNTTTITAQQDTTYEGNETVKVDITSVTNGTESGTQQVTATITDDDSQPSVTLSINNPTIAEASGTATVTATLSNASTQNVTVNLGYTLGTATLGTDFTAGNSIVINAGSLSNTTTITAQQDTTYESNETAKAEITSVTNGTESGTQQVTTTITDDDALPGDGTGLKGDYYNNTDFTSFVLTRTDATVDFNWSIYSPDPAIGADTFSVRWTGQVQAQYSETYTFYTVSDDCVRLWVNSQQLINNWTPHGSTEDSGTIALTAGVKYDITMEYYEGASAAVARLLWSSPSTTKATIPQAQLYPTPQPSVTLSVNPTSISENGATATVTATLSNTSTQTVTVNLGYTAGTATLGIDFTAGNSIVINAGSLSNTTTITALNDGTTYEGNETVIVDITSVTNGTEQGTQTVTATITDDDPQPSVTLSATPLTLSESGASSTLTATLSNLSTQNVTVTLGYTAGTATLGTDFTSPSSIVINAGQPSNTGTITTLNDGTTYEGDETIKADITSVTNGTESGTQQVTATITDDDPPPGGVTPPGVVDTITQGTWRGVYGTDGYILCGFNGDGGAATDVVNLPSYISSHTIPGLSRWNWYKDTTNVYDLQQPLPADGSLRNVGAWYTASSGTVHLIPSQSRTFKLSLYLRDTTGTTRWENISFTGAGLTGTDYVQCTSGKWISYIVTATAGTDVVINVQWQAGANAIISALMFDPVAQPSVTLGVNPSSFSEAGGSATLTATLSNTSSQNVTVNLGYTAGTATLGTDFTASNSIVINAGSLSNTTPITALNDGTTYEGNETVIVDITSITNGTESGGFQQVTATITDDDPSPTGINPPGVVNTTAKGTWRGVFGTDGYILFSFTGSGSSTTDTASLPSYINFYTDSGLGRYHWSHDGTNAYDLQQPPPASGSLRNCGCVNTASSGSICLKPNQSRTFKLSVYMRDYDSAGRSDGFSFTGAGLVGSDSFACTAGKWVSYTVTCTAGVDIVLNLSMVAGPSGTISALMFDPVTNNDVTAPAQIQNLTTSNPSSSSIKLTWTAPGDDVSTGNASTYDIRYRTGGAVNDSNWASATQVTYEPFPAAPGTSQSLTVWGLAPSTTYYFAMKTLDEVPNTSLLSNCPAGRATLAAVPSASKPLLAPKDFKYKGYYKLQSGSSLYSTGYGQGFTHRYVSGQLRFLTLTWNAVTAPFNYRLIEFAAPAFLGSTVTTRTNLWPDIMAGTGLSIEGTGRWHGIWYDEAQNRLWTTWAIDYPDTQLGQDEWTKSLAVRTLNADGTISNVAGPWGLQGIQQRLIYGGVIAVPSWFQTTYNVGPYAAGWGGYASRMSAGPVSLGPTFYTFPEPTGYPAGDIPTSAVKTLMNHNGATLPGDWYPSGSPTSYDRGVRNSDTSNEYDLGEWLSPAPDGLGRWMWGDSNWNTGCWIETPNKQGFILVPKLCSGRGWYTNQLYCERQTAEIQVFDPDILGEVAQGSRAAWNTYPTYRWHITDDMRPLGLVGGAENSRPTGATYDPTTQTLYVYGTRGSNDNAYILLYDVDKDPGTVDDVAIAETAVTGTVSGTRANTETKDSVRESVQEVVLSNKSQLERKWTFTVTGGSSVVFNIKGHCTSNTEGDNFVFAYSTNGTSWTNMVTVSRTTDDGTFQTYTLPGGISGTVYVRVQDADRTAGRTSLDTIYIDKMFFCSNP